MLATFDSNGKFLSVFKKELLELSDEAKKCFEQLGKMDISDQPKDWLKWAEAMGYTDDTLLKFLTDERYGTKDLATYNTYLKEQSKQMGIATASTKALTIAKNALINIGFAVGALAITKAVEALDEYIVIVINDKTIYTFMSILMSLQNQSPRNSGRYTQAKIPFSKSDPFGLE